MHSSVLDLPGVGSKLEATLNRLGIHKIQDLLFHLPFRYLDQTRLTPIGAMQAGHEYLIEGTVDLCQIQFGRRRQLVCRISDGTGAILVRLFHFSRTQQDALTRGTFIRCWGAPRDNKGLLEMIHPEYRILPREQLGHTEATLTPVYPTTDGLAQTRIRRFTGQALDLLGDDGKDPLDLLPRELLDNHQLPDLPSALRYVHRPPPYAEIGLLLNGIHPAQQRLAFEELLAHQLGLKALRNRYLQVRAPAITPDRTELDRFLHGLPFRLTSAQSKVLEDVLRDLQRPTPMLRLVQGDVGSGKTVLAAIAALMASIGGYQAVYMAPTEILAEQHYANISRLLDGRAIPVIYLSGSLSQKLRNAALERMRDLAPAVIIGTHALFQEDVAFGRLGLVIIDEQHRFGVAQRLALFEKGVAENRCPHQMIMTATPIPRTLMMTAFADLDLSVIDEMPPGRAPVLTVALSNTRRNEVIKRIAAICGLGQQAYWVCTLIEESENLQAQAAEETREFLTGMLPSHRIGLIHGRMTAREKDKVMRAYTTGQLDVLVATTVIEV
ncbi:MAG TPA: ATP-dependent DNA helicase RecG, partial [Gammaproteobacteria bacterium]|nr:ATP-dependent DNA helicase RecG [Gammaproteobacteria bacterium]